MSDSVSKLYAELGFKVNQNQLKEAKNTIIELSKQMSKMNEATKKAAEQFGIFSKDKARQELNDAKVANEVSKKALSERKAQAISEIVELKKINQEDIRARRGRAEELAKEKSANAEKRKNELHNKRLQLADIRERERQEEKAAYAVRKNAEEKRKDQILSSKLSSENEKQETQRLKRNLSNKNFEHKQLMDLARLEFQVEKYNVNEKRKIEQQQAREAEKASKEQQKRLKNEISAFRNFAVSLRNTFLKLTSIGGVGVVAGMKQSLDRAIPTRDFMMSTGVTLPELQSVVQRMVNTGSQMTQQQIMGDIQKVSQNLKDISLGGGDIVPYKLAGVAASGNVMDVIKATEQAVKGLDNAMALNLTRRVGLSDDWLASWRFKERYGGDQVQLSKEQQIEIANTKVALGQLAYGFRLLADQITAVLSPVIEEVSDLMRDSFQGFARFLKDNSEEFREKIKEIIDAITKYIREIDWKNVWENIKSVGRAIGEFASMVHKFAKLLGIAEDEKEKEPTYTAEKHWWGVKKKPISEYKPSTVGNTINASLSPDTMKMVSSFSSAPRRSAVISSIDNHVNNVTINGVFQDELKEEMVNAIEEDKQKSGVYNINDRISDISQLWFVGHSATASGGM